MRIRHDAALAIARSVALPLGSECAALLDALGRIAATSIAAPYALPGFASSAMDGYAIRGDDRPVESPRSLRVAAQVLAGDSRVRTLAPGDAAAIMTGALLPTNADTVVMREDARLDGDRVWIAPGIQRGAHVRAADDDCAAGAAVLSAGECLGAARLSQLAAFGIQTVEVARRPRVAVLVTGDELLAPGADTIPGRRHDSNGTLLSGLALTAGARLVACERCGDDPQALRLAIGRLAAQADMLITSGGVSAGAADHLPDVIESLGSVHFWKVQMKPGMPVLCATIGDCLVFALPGNPVSSGVTFQTLARPALDAMQGRTTPHGLTGWARLSVPWHKAHDRLEFLRVRLHVGNGGEWQATPLDHQGSGALSRLADADALAVLAEGGRDYAAGDCVAVETIARS